MWPETTQREIIEKQTKITSKIVENIQKTRHFPLPPSCSRVKVSYEREKISKLIVVKLWKVWTQESFQK